MKWLVCECGQRLFRRDVVQQHYYIRPSGPCFVYLKYRCSRCNRLGEQYVRQEDWFSTDIGRGIGALEPEGPSGAVGPITEAERSAFRRELYGANPLESLGKWIEGRSLE